MTNSTMTRLSLVLVAACLAACSAAPATAPVAAAQTPLEAAQAARDAALVPAKAVAKATVRFTFTLPASAARKVQYVSANTASVSVQLGDGTPVVTNVVAGQSTYAVDVVAPVGAQTFTVKAYDAADATGNVLSQGSVIQTIAEGVANNVGITLNGVVSALALSVADTTPQIGGGVFEKAVTFSARDAAGNVILGDFATPVTVAVTGGTGVSVTTLSLTGSGSTLHYIYDGTSASPITLTASAAGATSGSVTLSPRVEALSVAIDQAKPAVLSNGSLGLSATVTYSNGTTGHTVAWSGANAASTIDGATGVLTGQAVGTTVVTAFAAPADATVSTTATAHVASLATSTASTPLEVGHAIALASSATMAVPGAPTYVWTKLTGVGALTGLNAATASYTPDEAAVGDHTFALAVSDADGYVFSRGLTVSVLPHLDFGTTKIQLLGTNETSALTVPVAYGAVTATSDHPEIATAGYNGTTGKIDVAAVAPGTATMTIVAPDGRQAAITVTVTSTTLQIQ